MSTFALKETRRQIVLLVTALCLMTLYAQSAHTRETCRQPGYVTPGLQRALKTVTESAYLANQDTYFIEEAVTLARVL